MLGYAEMLLEEDDGSYPRELRGVLDQIRAESLKLNQCLNEVFNIEAPEQNKEEVITLVDGLNQRATHILGLSRQGIGMPTKESDDVLWREDLRKVEAAALRSLDLHKQHLPEALFTQQPDLANAVFEARATRTLDTDPDPEVVEGKPSIHGLILVVDDDATNRDMLVRRLTNQGHTVYQAEDGEEATNTLRSTAPDVVLLDMIMPRKNGYQVLREIKANDSLKHVPVIMISALDEIEGIAKCIEAGAEDYLPKPCNPVFLKARIDAALEKKRLRDQEQIFLEKLQVSELNFRSLLEDNPDPMLVFSEDGNALFLNPSARRLFPDASTSPAPILFQGPIEPASAKEIAITRNDEEGLIFELRTSNTLWGEKDAVLAALRDITQRKKDEKKIREQQVILEDVNRKLEQLATLDGLTKLKNHRVFQEKIREEFQKAVRYKMPLSLILMDVDDFKGYNDRFGHPAGDEVLKGISKILRGMVRETDLAARYGGEEFAVIMPYTEGREALLLSHRLLEAIRIHSWPHRSITASLGVSSYAPNIEDASVLIKQADIALYESKHSGRDRATHFTDMAIKEA